MGRCCSAWPTCTDRTRMRSSPRASLWICLKRCRCCPLSRLRSSLCPPTRLASACLPAALHSRADAKATAKKLRWHTQATESTQATPAVTRQAPLGTRRAGESMVVTLSPMEIRTFNVKLSSKAKNSPGTASARRMK
eukprot:scaffold1381_cov386-Prasinococcus_capsulatus_cf.AAC.20